MQNYAQILFATDLTAEGTRPTLHPQLLDIFTEDDLENGIKNMAMKLAVGTKRRDIIWN